MYSILLKILHVSITLQWVTHLMVYTPRYWFFLGYTSLDPTKIQTGERPGLGSDIILCKALLNGHSLKQHIRLQNESHSSGGLVAKTVQCNRKGFICLSQGTIARTVLTIGLFHFQTWKLAVLACAMSNLTWAVTAQYHRLGWRPRDLQFLDYKAFERLLYFKVCHVLPLGVFVLCSR